MASNEFETESSGSQESLIVNLDDYYKTSHSSNKKICQLPDDARDMEIVDKFIRRLQEVADDVKEERRQKQNLDQFRNFTTSDRCDYENEKIINRLKDKVDDLYQQVKNVEDEADYYRVLFFEVASILNKLNNQSYLRPNTKKH